MPNELSVKAIPAVAGGTENPAEPQAEPLTPPAHAPPAASASPMPNPQLRLDPALGLVVIEFRDANGTVTTSIPSQRQLNAYRIWDQAQPNPGALPGSSQTGSGYSDSTDAGQQQEGVGNQEPGAAPAAASDRTTPPASCSGWEEVS